MSEIITLGLDLAKKKNVFQVYGANGCPQPDRGEDARPDGFRRTHRRKSPGPSDWRNPDPHRSDEPLLGPRNGRDRPRGLTTAGKGAIMPQA